MSQEQPIAIHWLRRDLRLQDNAALFQALSSGLPVLPVFIFDRVILDELKEDKTELTEDKRVVFIHQALLSIQSELRAWGSDLLVLYDDPMAAWNKILSKFPVAQVFTNHDYEPYAVQRDEQLAALLQAKGIVFKTFKDQCIFEKGEVLKDDGKPYTVFTPYSRKWKHVLESNPIKTYDCDAHFGQFYHTKDHFNIPGLESMGFLETSVDFPSDHPEEEILRKYGEQRDIPSIRSTSRLGVHLRFGTISIRKLALKALENSYGTYLNELIWRDFYMMILWHFPHVVGGAFRPEYDKIPWKNNPEEFELWCQGKTGYPIVDAGMRELNATGFMHNRVRMIVASFLTKHLLIDWRWGEAYFAKKLLDFELSSNNGGWQWAAGSGCDAAPYFRVFNPELQTQKFDPKGLYIRQWVEEFDSLEYPAPMVDHAFARKRALETYGFGLGKTAQTSLM
jgi:deoxyribodipyrimidine photo-lyase